MSDPVSIYRNNLLIVAIFTTIVFLISFPIYIYGIVKFLQFRHHLVITKRFPVISISIILISFLNGTCNNIIEWIDYSTNWQPPIPISAGLSLFVYGLINIRLCLIYLRCRQHDTNCDLQIMTDIHTLSKQISQSQSSISDSSNHAISRNETASTHNNIYHHWCCILILTITIISFIYITFVPGWSNFDAIIVGISWTAQIIISMIFVSIIVCKKMKEGIGCLKETVILLLIIMFDCFSFPLTFISDIMTVAMAMLFNLTVFILGLIPLYAALYYIGKIEGTLTVSNLSNRFEEQIKRPNIVNNQRLSVFIQQYENYKILKEYLSYCWAVENLLFYQKTSIFYQIMLKYKNLCTNTVQNKEQQNGAIENRNKFKYLSSIYTEYESKIGIEYEKGLKFEDLREKIFSVQQEIYQQFIKNGSIHEINISFQIRQRLSLLLENSVSVNRFQSFDDFLFLYDNAMVEVYGLILSMYHYRFTSYAESKQN